LILNDSKQFIGQISGFTCDGTLANSDSIDIKDIHLATATETYTENSAGTGGTLTISDGTNTANLDFSGNYTLANFKFSDDGSGGVLILDPPTTEPAGEMTLVNEDTIIAAGTNALIIDTGSNVVTNAGTLEATGSGGLIVNSEVANSGLIWADGGNITILGAITG
jgi:hypothetical protein